MELFAGAPLPLALLVLALVDGLSVGTLLIPVFLLLSPGRVRAGRILLYLAAIAAFYLVVGLLFLWGLINVVDVAADFFASPAGVTIRLVVGVGLVVAAILIPTKPAGPGPSRAATAEVASAHRSGGLVEDGMSEVTGAADGARRPGAWSGSASADPARPGRIVRWREKLLDPRTGRAAVMAVAIAAGLVEVATMLPYIVAMTMLADAGIATPVRILAVAGYCLVMILPALVLLLLRIVAAPLVARPLQRFADWMQRTGAENTAWIIGILGFLIARSAANELGLFENLGRLGG